MSQSIFDFGGRAPLVVCCGVGVDSIAVLVGLYQRGIRPDAVVFADVGAEKRPTYGYIPILQDWLKGAGFPELVIVRYQPKDFKHWPPYATIEENILTNVSLPAIAYGGHSCSAKWKISAINAWLDQWPPALEAWAHGLKVRKMIGFEDSPHEHRRRIKGCATFAIQDDEVEKYTLEFPLQDWHWNRETCEAEIEAAGLPIPEKSACYFCTAMKPWEVDRLAETDPEKLRRIVILEARTTQRHLDYAESKGWPKGPGVPMTAGLWRKAVKGMRGATPRPGSMTEYIRQKQLMPECEIDALIERTPTHHFTQADFQREGIRDWQDWIQRIIASAEAACEQQEIAV